MSYVLSLAALVLGTLPSLLKGKNMKLILLFLCIGNFFVTVSYVLDGGFNGAAASIMGVVCTLINFILEVKNKPVPKALVAFYIVLSVVVNLWVSKGVDLYMLLVAGAGVAFHISTTRKNGRDYRFWILFNLLLWCVYDTVSASYSVLITHGIQLLTNVFGMIVHDRKKVIQN